MPFVRWEEPPARAETVGRAAQRAWSELRGFLRGNPGRWALVCDDLDQWSASNASVQNLGKHGFETALRSLSNSHIVRLYARWPGDA